MPPAQVKAKAAKVAATLGITDIRDRPVGGLSGGGRQRIALGRAIVRNPKCLPMDDPLGALDAAFREHLSEEQRALHDRMGAPLLYVIHDLTKAMTMATHVSVLDHG